jgi:hypothetical protein
MRDQLPPEGFDQNGLIEPWKEPRGVAVFVDDAIDPRESGFDTANDFGLFYLWRKTNVKCSDFRKIDSCMD